MRCIFLFFGLCFLFGCSSNIPSETITNNAIRDLTSITSDLDNTLVSLPKECQNDAVRASFGTIKARVNSVEGQVKTISLACQSEKNVLEEKIINRNLIIAFLFAIIVLLVYVLFRFIRR